ncbi:hypothetical protein EG328_005560 [Venturia inaequalis]|uniref:DUF221-domain-containing protein n=1 Tax=Venturia inaequalis TaxID=5025 RepID=A0A8H3YS19_VENIN|nr:hypothetical protein EG328_005560 [Venturia inaequalis]KAE9993115.1 hypothetical protein EG327_006468 [Venturia inaequalis]
MSFNASQGAGSALTKSGQSAATFAASLGGGLAIFGVYLVGFWLLREKFSRIYRPKTFLVAEKDRVPPPPKGFFRWISPVFSTPNNELISKCGLDAYFFLRYLRMLLKIFIPSAILILPILIPINSRGNNPDVKGLDKYGWQNYDRARTDRFWAHLLLAVAILMWFCYNVYDELRGYIRVRQAYLTSPQHRLRASATTVLVTSIPRKWLTCEALDGLYDVFPGGIRNIWINRNFDELNDKVQLRDSLAAKLENAETSLIRNAKKKHNEQLKKEAKASKKSRSKKDKKRLDDETDAAGVQMANQPGLSSGNPHQPHTVDETLDEVSDDEAEQDKTHAPVFGAISEFGHGIAGFGRKVVDDVANAPKFLNDRVEGLYKVHDFQADGPGGNRSSEVSKFHDSGDTEPIVGRRPNKLDISDFDGSKEHGGRVHLDPPTPTTVRPSTSASKKVAHTDWTNGFLEPAPKRGWRIWKDSHGVAMPSPEPKSREEAELGVSVEEEDHKRASSEEEKYPPAYKKQYLNDEGFEQEPRWKQYLNPEDRDTMRLPLFGFTWLPFMPSWTFIGQKLDTIYYCRKEIARLNLEIEQDQSEPEKFPLMNSAFIQFNSQVAAHMACQSVSHHMPSQMAPRIVEIAPGDVIWDNMSMKWWERYLRVILVFAIVVGLVLAWAVPVSFLTGLANLSQIQDRWPNIFGFIDDMPGWFRSALQGLLPPALTAALLALLPVILRLLASQQGVPTGMGVELSVQGFYFAFIFVQLFLIVTLARSIFSTLSRLAKNPGDIFNELGRTVPTSSNYFFSYMILQALSVSSGALFQVGSLVVWFLLRPIIDNTARQKFNRQLNLPSVQWGTFFPVYTNFGCIGLIFSVISPLIMIFNIITFSLFWIAYRYNTLYVNKFRFDTGGLLFPKAVNQLFTGIYVMEIALIGLFLTVENEEKKNLVCLPQAIIVAVLGVLTVGFHIMLNFTFSPLFRYMPITLEDDAVARDEEFERAQSKKWLLASDEQPEEDIEDALERREQSERKHESEAEAIELEQISQRRRSRHLTTDSSQQPTTNDTPPHSTTWADRARRRRTTLQANLQKPTTGLFNLRAAKPTRHTHDSRRTTDIETAGQPAIGDALFGTFSDEIEDLTPQERDMLVRRAFQHEALRARRPVIWIPRDDLGISDDEIRRTNAFSGKIWISNEYTGLDSKARVIFRRAPPDFSEVDLIEL